MQNPNLRTEGPKPKRAPRWRELSDEEQWDSIYKGRELKRVSAPRNVHQAAALCLPSYCLQMAIQDCHKTFAATIREDVHIAILSSLARVAAMLPNEKKRAAMLDILEIHYGSIRASGFYLHNREFLYANAAALIRLVDDFRFPAEAPVVTAALLIKEDAESDEAGDWSLDMRHAQSVTGLCYDKYLSTEMYRYPDAEMRG